jgi:NAD(P)H-hydrate epimerase
MKLVTVEQMRHIESQADAAGNTYDMMMDRAGAALARVIQQQIDAPGKRILVLVGPGNNGGDGLVLAKMLREAGADVSCYGLKPRDDARLSAARDAGAFVAAHTDDRGQRVLRRLTLGADVIVDALFGTGSRLPLSGDAQKLLNVVKSEVDVRRGQSEGLSTPRKPAARSLAPLVVAVDGPSGMQFDSGEIDTNALPADISVTFAYPKIGHTRFPAASICGQLVVADIGTDPALAKEVALELADAAYVRPRLPARPIDAHKGSFGKALIVAGSLNYTGAPALAAQAAYRSGAGLVTLALPGGILPMVAAHLSEATYLSLPNRYGTVTPDAVKVLGEALDHYDAMLLGPGLTRDKDASDFIERLLGTDTPSKRPMGFAIPLAAESESGRDRLPALVVDADGLNILAGIDNWWVQLPESSVLTPHVGEMQRLSKVSKDEIEADRIGVASAYAKEWGHVVVLKGAFSVVAAPGGEVVVMPFATPALATAGSGDVLAGAIVALRAQGVSAFDAAVCGAYLHGLAGAIAEREIGASGVVASDLLMRLPVARRQIAS